MAKKVWASLADKIAIALEQRAEEEGRSRSDLIAYLLEDAMKQWHPQVNKATNAIDIEAIRDVIVALATNKAPHDSASIYKVASELGLNDDQLLALQQFKKRKNGNGVGNGKS